MVFNFKVKRSRSLNEIKAVLCLTTSYPCSREDLAGHFVKRLNDQYPKTKWRVYVVCFQRGFQSVPRDELLKNEKSEASIFAVTPLGRSLSDGAPDRLSASPLLTGVGLVVNSLKLYLRYRKVYRYLQMKYLDEPIVVAHWSIPCGWMARYKRPVIYCHGGDIALLESLPIGGLLRTWLARSIFSRASRVICVSEQLSQRLVRLIDQRDHHVEISTIPMGVCEPNPCDKYLKYIRNVIQEARGSFGQELYGTHHESLQEPLLVLSTVGRLVPIKGYDLLVEGIGLLPIKLRERILWLMAGEGGELERLRSRAKALGVRLKVLGQLSPRERDALLAETELFVAPSRQIGSRVEGAPLALREAALMGCSLMATGLGGVSDLLAQLPKELAIELEPSAISLHDHLKCYLENTRIKRDIKRAQHQMIKRSRELWLWSSIGKTHTQILSESTH